MVYTLAGDLAFACVEGAVLLRFLRDGSTVRLTGEAAKALQLVADGEPEKPGPALQELVDLGAVITSRAR